MRVRKLLAICALMVLAGCASSGIKYTDAGAAPARLKPGQGRVYFYRTVLIGLAIQPDIKLNGQAVGAAIPGGFFFVDRPSGGYVATATRKSNRDWSSHWPRVRPNTFGPISAWACSPDA